MEVKIIRAISLPGVNANGPFTREFKVGDIVDVPDMQANIWIAQNDAVLIKGKVEKATDEAETEKPAPKKTTKKN